MFHRILFHGLAPCLIFSPKNKSAVKKRSLVFIKRFFITVCSLSPDAQRTVESFWPPKRMAVLYLQSKVEIGFDVCDTRTVTLSSLCFFNKIHVTMYLYIHMK